MFDDEGLFLQRFRVDPELGLIFHIDQKGYVYTMSEDEVPMIHKYRISFMSK